MPPGLAPPRSSCRTFPSRLRANLKRSKLGKRGEYRATCIHGKKAQTALQKSTRYREIEQKNRHLTGRLGASEALFARAPGGKADAKQATYRLDGGHYR